MKLEQFFFNCSQEDWGQSWNRHKDSILDYSVVNQGCPCQAAKGNSMTLVPVTNCCTVPSYSGLLLRSSSTGERSFVFAGLRMRNSPLRMWCLPGVFRLPNAVSTENSCLVATLWTCIVAFLCASALEQLISFSSLHPLWILFRLF